MSKELEELNDLNNENIVYVHKEDWSEIQKKLKALEIMKQQLPNLLLIRNTKDYDEFLEKAGDNLIEEEYDLLKEVLKDE